MGISIVIRAYNEAEHIGRLLSGLENQTVKADQIIVVDSRSKDATRDIAQHFGAEIVDIDPKDFTFGRALNYGCEAATEDILVFLSAHVRPVYNTFLEHLVAPFSNADVAVSYGRQIGDHRTKYSESRVMLQWFPAESTLRQKHAFCNNANAAIRRSLWVENLYDEQLTGLEDLEWAGRMHDRGHAVSYVAEAPVVHVHEETWATVRNRYRREAIAYKSIVGDSGHVSARASISLALRNIINDYLHAFIDNKLLENLTQIPRFRMEQFIGAWQGTRQAIPKADQLHRRFYYPKPPQKARPASHPGTPIEYRDLITDTPMKIA